MKLSVIYFSKSGKTKQMAEIVAEGARAVPGMEAGVFSLEDIDYDFLEQSRAVVFGTPTYYANISWQLKRWLDESWKCRLEGKIGSVFTTAEYIQGGADIALLSAISCLLTKGMLVYSGGTALGQPFTHLGPVATKESFENSKAMFQIFGQRIAQKTTELFS